MSLVIRSLHIYPVKSCAGIDLAESAVDERGLAHDRRWMVVDEEGMFLTQRTLPAMALIRPALRDGGLRLDAPGMLPLDVPADLPAGRAGRGESGRGESGHAQRPVRVWRDDVPADDAGDEAAAWLSAFLRQPCRLVRMAGRARRLAGPDRVAAWRLQFGAMAPGLSGEHAFGFADGYPFLITAQASLDDLNARLAAAGEAPVPMNRFRPNIVLDGLEAYDEDHLAMLACGEARFALVKPCTRCAVPDVDQLTARRGEAVGRTLAAYRSREAGVVFGQNAVVQAGPGAVLRVGDEVRADWAF